MSIDRRRVLLAPLALGAAGLAPSGRASAQAGAVTIRVAYSYPQNYTEMKREIVRLFEPLHPGVKVVLEPPSADYEVMIQSILRQVSIGEPLPEVAFHGLHRVRLLVERNLIVPIDDLIRAEPNWAALGYIPAMQRLGAFNGRDYALSFAVSNMVAHWNGDLVARAGGDPNALPTTWDGILDLARRMRALGDPVQGLYWSYYDTTNNWTFHSLVQSHGGEMMSADDRTIAFDGPAGLQALQLARRMGETGMLDMRDAQAAQSFGAGTLGVFIVSSSRTEGFNRAARNRFRYITTPLPIGSDNATFPAGGSGAMIHTRDPVKQKAAWEFVKFATGPIGQTVMVRNSGYMPGNELPLQDPALLGTFYQENPNHRAPLTQASRMTRFYSFPGENSLKIPNVIRDHLQTVVTLRRRPEEVMSDMVRDVRALLPREG